MIEVTLVTNDGSGVPQTTNVREGTTVGDFLDLMFDGRVDDFTIQLRPSNGVSREAELGDELEDGCRVTLAPTKVEGASPC